MLNPGRSLDLADPRDALQVKYEMLRRVRREGEAPGPGDAIINGLLVARFAPKPARDEDLADDLETR